MKQSHFRSVSVFATALSFVAATLGGAAFNKADAQDAVAYRSNATHTAQANMPDFVLPVRRVWSHTFSGKAGYALIANNLVMVEIVNATGSNFNHLYALSAKTGKVVWGPIPLTDAGTCGLAYDNNRIFLTYTSDTEFPVTTACRSAATGQLLWTDSLNQQSNDYQSPTPYDGYIYTQTNGIVYCLRESDGGIVWSTPQFFTTDGALSVSPAGIFLSGYGGECYSLDPATGDVIWNYQTGVTGGGGGTCAYFDNDVFIRDYYNGTYPNPGAAIHAVNGELDHVFSYLSPMAFDNGLMVGVTSDSSLTAINLSDWSAAWKFKDAENPPVTAPTIVNDVVYVGAANGDLFGYDEATGKKMVSVHLGAVPSAVLESYCDMAAGDGLIVVPAGNTVYAVGD